MSDFEFISLILKCFAAFGLSMMLFALLPKTKARRFLAFLISSFIAFTYAKTPQQQSLGNREAAANFAQREQLSALMDEDDESDEDIENDDEVSEAVEELRVSEFTFTTNSVIIESSVAAGVLVPENKIGIQATTNIAEAANITNWTFVAEGDVLPGETNCVIEVLHSALPNAWDRKCVFYRPFLFIDTDGDGICDFFEITIYGTDPDSADSDNDGLPDGWELTNGFEPTEPNDTTQDSDGDGVPDYQEYINGTDPNDAYEYSEEGDEDGDGISNKLEEILGLDVFNDDTDGDGVLDIDDLADLPWGVSTASEAMLLDEETSSAFTNLVTGIFSVELTFGSNTVNSAASMLGITWPGGTTTTTNLDGLHMDGNDANTAFDFTATGGVFHASQTGWYKFQMKADDTATMTIAGEDVSAEWSKTNREGLGELKRILLQEGSNYPIRVTWHNNGGKADLSFPVFGEFEAIEEPTVSIEFAADAVYGAEEGPEFISEMTLYTIDVYGGEFGGTLNTEVSSPNNLAYVLRDEFPNGVEIAPFERRTFQGVYRGVLHPLERSIMTTPVYLTCTLVEDQTGRNISTDDMVEVRFPEICGLNLEYVKFNHDIGSSSHDAINLRFDANHAINAKKGEWRKRGAYTEPVCYVAGTHNISVKVGFNLGSNISTNLAVQMNAFNFVASGFSSQNVSFVNGRADNVEFVSNSVVPNVLTWDEASISWSLIDSNYEAECSNIKYYIIPHEPMSPWINKYGSRRNAWVEVLDYACGSVQGGDMESSAMANLTAAMFSRGDLRYDTNNGAPACFINNNTFNLSQYLHPLGEYLSVNCSTQAWALYLLARMVGVDTKVVKTEPFGYIKSLNLVGIGTCNNPFFSSNSSLPVCEKFDPRRTLFSCHVYIIFRDKVYDSCVGPVAGELTNEEYLLNVIDNDLRLTYPDGGSEFNCIDFLDENSIPTLEYPDELRFN